MNTQYPKRLHGLFMITGTDAILTYGPIARVFILVALIILPVTARADYGVDVYGLSYHFNRAQAHALGSDNWFNPGLGVRYRIPQVRENIDVFINAGFYRDSGRHTAKLAAASALWHATDNMRLGAALAIFNSGSYNNGKTFLAPLPVAAYEFDSTTINMVYIPKYRGVNDVSALGFWVTFWLK